MPYQCSLLRHFENIDLVAGQVFAHTPYPLPIYAILTNV